MITPLKSARHSVLLAIVALPALHGSAFASGACCSVSGGDPGRLSVTVAGASAMNHEAIGADTYELSQQALLLKLGKPVGRGFVLQAQIGMPTATKLSHKQMDLSGNGGLIYGAGVGYKLPRLFNPVDFSVSASYSRSLAYLDKDMTGTIDQTFHINEFQVLFIGETALAAKTALYAGLRAVYDRPRGGRGLAAEGCAVSEPPARASLPGRKPAESKKAAKRFQPDILLRRPER